jgi:hypothetical protein
VDLAARTFFVVFICWALGANAACGGPYHDILDRSDALLAPVWPPDCATVLQSPPDFTWPPQDGENLYSVTLIHPGGKSEKLFSAQNVLAWPRMLAPGKYQWKVGVKGRYTDESALRSFTVDAAAAPFVMPSADEALARAKKTPRPRTWAGDAGMMAALKAERAHGFKELLDEVDADRRKALPPQPDSRSRDENYDAVVRESKRTLAAAFAWAAMRGDWQGADAVRRVMSMASWSPRGPAGYSANDMAGRTLVWTLVLGYDWLQELLTPSQKGVLLAAIKAHAQPMFSDIVPRISKYPYDSHGNVTLSIAAAVAGLMAGDIPEADDWLRKTVPLAMIWTSPWGWQDGGFGNGTAQLFWDAQANLPAWYVYRNAMGIDLAKKPWVRNLSRAMAFFVPPGSPAGNFGDGQELDLHEVWARVGKAQAAFAPTPLAKWYAGAQKGEDQSRLELLVAPRSEVGPAPFPADAGHAALFPSIGWVAMHSDLADPRRTSVYFKSSPYGSYNHSHSDQNSFAIVHRGKRLAIASGYYDGYRTQHWLNWYKLTRAANAITFDGGHGQGFNDRRFAGGIVAFGHTPAFDHAVGRAEKAYAGALSLAQRSIAYLRPNTILVYDTLASESPHTWEWNIHAMNAMNVLSNTRVALTNGDATLCVEMLASPPVAFTQTDRFAAAPEDQKMVNQWHGAFATTQVSLKAEFVALLRVGADCRQPSGASAARVPEGWRVNVEGKSVLFAGERVQLM